MNLIEVKIGEEIYHTDVINITKEGEIYSIYLSNVISTDTLTKDEYEHVLLQLKKADSNTVRKISEKEVSDFLSNILNSPVASKNS